MEGISIGSKTVTIFFIAAFINSLFINHLFAIEGQTSEEPIRRHVEYQAGDLRDPFKGHDKEEKEQEIEEPQEAPQEPTEPLPSLTIQGIVWGGSIPQAIINDKIVKVGDMIGSSKIIKIDKDGITLLYEGRQYNLSSPAAASLQSLQKQKPKEGKNE